MKNIVLIGSFGSSNIGDEAILESMLIFLREHFPSSSIHILSPNPHDTELRYVPYAITVSRGIPFGIRSIFLHGKEFLSKISFFKQTTHVIFPGGGLWTDHESIYAVLLWSIHIVFFNFILHKPIILVGQSFGPLKSRIARIISRFILKRCKKILVRDTLSYSLLSELGIEESKISVMHDMVCYIPQKTPVKEPSQSAIQHIAISLRPWKNTPLLLEELVMYLHKKHLITPIHLHFIPMQYHGNEDISYIKAMAHACDLQNIPYTEHFPHTYKEVLQILNSCSSAIGMRLHFLILATLAHVPLFAFAYSTKVVGFLKSIPLTNYHLVTQSSSSLSSKLDIFFHQDIEKIPRTLTLYTDQCKQDKTKDLTPLLEFLQ